VVGAVWMGPSVRGGSALCLRPDTRQQVPGVGNVCLVVLCGDPVILCLWWQLSAVIP
jgi:hypothetical protein